jgi:phospholipase/lecithinase/hemolysin
MRAAVRQLIILASFLMPHLLFANPIYSRLIVFGDSLSDIGNMPESPNLIEPAYHAIALNLYVPISNPCMNGKPSRYTLVTNGKQYPFPKHAPQPQPSLQIGHIRLARKAYSLAWPQFFTARAFASHRLKSPEIWPWFWWETHSHTNPNLSIDYAWAGAVTDDLCRNFSYNNPDKSCTIQTILAGQSAYRASGFRDSGAESVQAVQVPGFGRQVRLFLEDSGKHPEISSPDTLYAILIGGNDLNLALMDLKNKKTVSAFNRVLQGAANQVRESIETLIEKRGARHIVLFNLFNTSQIPYIQTELWQHKLIPIKDKPSFIELTQFITRLYNRELQFVVYRINKRYNSETHRVNIELLDFYNLMQEVQNLRTFSDPKTRYQMCLDAKKNPDSNYYTSPNDCTNGKAKYLFWNGAHPSMYLEEVIADKLLTQISKKHHDLKRQLKTRVNLEQGFSEYVHDSL